MAIEYSSSPDPTGASLFSRLSLALGAMVLAAFTMVTSPAIAHDGYAELVEELRPSVVSIYVIKQANASANMPEFNFPKNSPFYEYFKEFFDKNQMPRQSRPGRALGSGFIIAEHGLVVTNNHVIDGTSKIVVQLYDGTELEAEIVGADPKTDIALLRVDADEPLPTVEFGDSEDVRVGDPVLVIGNPHGYGFSVSSGIVSARNRSLRGSYDDFLQTDAAMNVGNSGGPLFNLDGEVIGVNTAIISPPGARAGSIGIGFSMSSAVVSKVVAQLDEFGTTRRGWIGVLLQTVTPEIAEAVGMENAAGAIIADVPDGPAQDAGLKQGDIILSFNDEEIPDVRTLVRVVGDTKAGTRAPIIVLRDQEEMTIEVLVGSREEAEEMVVNASLAKEPESDSADLLGIRLGELTPEVREQFGLADDAAGLAVLEVSETSTAFELNIRPGDVIVGVDHAPVSSIDDVRDGIRKVRNAGRNNVLVLIERGGRQLFVGLPLGG